MKEPDEERIVQSWCRNAAPWTAAVRDKMIRSRSLVTDRAIVDAVVSRSPRSVLDVGCGEGWLSRELSARQIQVTGIDAVAGLVECARVAGGGDFRVMSYESLASGQLDLEVDAIVCNFALIGKTSVEGLLAAVRSLLGRAGSIVIQTLHPLVACDDAPYRDGWRDGSWNGFDGGFTDPAPWYFRTLASWFDLLGDSGLRLIELREPLHPDTGMPASLIFIADVAT
ncbi:MAG: class I SAM-dependent methyltransferase [Rhodanobacteraceae bacterium]